MTFPSNPTTGQTFQPTPTFPVTYIWTGYSWKAVNPATGAGRGFVFGPTPPEKAASSPGDFWMESTTGHLYAFVDDEDDCHWVQIS